MKEEAIFLRLGDETVLLCSSRWDWASEGEGRASTGRPPAATPRPVGSRSVAGHGGWTCLACRASS